MSDRQTDRAQKTKTQSLNRRKFLRSTASVGAGLVFTPTVFAESEQTSKTDDINVALIGLGEQCGRLTDALFKDGMYKTNGIRFKAVCDIWPFRLKRIYDLLKRAYKFDVNAYENYEEMLEKEKSLDAAIIATPDWLHAPMTIYDYTLATGSVRAFYQVLNTTCWGTYGQYFETFMGEYGTLLISEFGGTKNNGWVFIEDYAKTEKEVAKKWNDSIRAKLIGGAYILPDTVKDKSILVLGGSTVLTSHPLLTKGPETVHKPHLQNFFDAIRGKAKLNCPGETGYETAVSVLKANEAIEKQGRVEFKPEDFRT